MNEVALGDVAYYLVGLGFLVVASAFFSGTEVAMFALRRVDREQLARSDAKRDRRLLRQLGKPPRLIETILIGNESVNVAVSVLTAGLCQRLFMGHVSETELALLAVCFALPILLVFGEVTPKAVAFKNALPWARRASPLLAIYGWVVTPLRLIVHGVANGLLKPFKVTTEDARGRELGEDEFRALVDAGSAQGQVDAHEQQLIHKVFEFGDKTVADVMVPRAKVFALSYDLPVARLLEEVVDRGFSRIPIYRRSLDNVRGVLYAKDLLIRGAASNMPQKLSELLHEPLFVVQTMPLARLFAIFKKQQTHLALVVNEYGKVVGLVTMENVLEQLFGEIRDERELQKSAMVVRLPVGPDREAGETG